jgi:dolichol kinase
MSRAWIRPAVHAGALGFAFLAPVLGRWGMAGAAFAAFLANALLLPRTALGRSLRREGEPRWNGVVTYPLGVSLLFACLRADAAVAGWAVMALGDPAAALVGRRVGGPRIPWNRRKSLAGTCAFFAIAWLGAGAISAAVWGASRERVLGDSESLAIYSCWIAAGAFAGAVVETLDPGVDDNLPVALAAGGTLAWLAGSPWAG